MKGLCIILGGAFLLMAFFIGRDCFNKPQPVNATEQTVTNQANLIENQLKLIDTLIKKNVDLEKDLTGINNDDVRRLNENGELQKQIKALQERLALTDYDTTPSSLEKALKYLEKSHVNISELWIEATADRETAKADKLHVIWKELDDTRVELKNYIKASREK